ncbi:MAG: hypothetical protein ACK59W_00825 [Pseudanabaena sp.]
MTLNVGYWFVKYWFVDWLKASKHSSAFYANTCADGEFACGFADAFLRCDDALVGWRSLIATARIRYFWFYVMSYLFP